MKKIKFGQVPSMFMGLIPIGAAVGEIGSSFCAAVDSPGCFGQMGMTFTGIIPIGV